MSSSPDRPICLKNIFITFSKLNDLYYYFYVAMPRRPVLRGRLGSKLPFVIAVAIVLYIRSLMDDPGPMSTQPCIPTGLLNRVPASAGVRRESHRCRAQVTLCDPIWHVISCSCKGVR